MTTRLQELARRLVDGSSILTHRLAGHTAAWIRKGRRDDLEGLAAVLGCALRAVLVALGLYLLWRLIRAFPNVLWLIVPVWCWQAIRTVPPADREAAPSEPPSEKPPASHDEVYDATLEWIHQQIARRNGIHLSELLSHAQAHGLFADLDLPNFRTTLERWHIPVRQQLKVGGRNRPGIHRDDLPPRAAPGTSPGPAEEDLPTRTTAA